jgi:SAM-dependent methyltransferase
VPLLQTPHSTVSFSGINPTEGERRKDGGFDERYYRTYYGSRTPDWYAGLLGEVIRFGKPGSVLDLGCGLGLFVELANQWGVRVTGIDGSQAAVRLALDRTPRLDLQQGNLMQPLSFPDQSFDNIIMHQVIPSFAPNVLINLLSQCHRVLRPGGVLFIFSASRYNLSAYERDPTQRYRLHPTELRAALESAGFSVLHEPNSSRFFPRNKLLGRLGGQLMRTRLKDWAAATANAYARRL